MPLPLLQGSDELIGNEGSSLPSSSAQTGSACGDADPAAGRPAGGGGRASAISPQLVGRARGRAAAAVWSLAPGSLLRTPHLTQGLGLAPGAWHHAGSWEDAPDPGRNAAMGETGKGDGKGPRRHLPLPARSCATGVSQRSLSGAAARFPVAHAFLSAAPCLLDGRACPVGVTDATGTLGRSARTKSSATCVLHVYTKLLGAAESGLQHLLPQLLWFRSNFCLHNGFHSESFQKCWTVITCKTRI